MKNRYIAILLLLTGCESVGSYQPSLTAPPKNEWAYRADLDACRDRVMHPKFNPLRAFGLIGNLAVEATVDDPIDDDLTNPTKRIDLCMKQRGYAVRE